MEKQPETLNIFVYDTFETEKEKSFTCEEIIKQIFPGRIPSYIKVEHLKAQMYFARPPTSRMFILKKNNLVAF